LISEHGLYVLNSLPCLKNSAVATVEQLQYADTETPPEDVPLGEFLYGFIWPVTAKCI
jgi:hypothetical protein